MPAERIPLPPASPARRTGGSRFCGQQFGREAQQDGGVAVRYRAGNIGRHIRTGATHGGRLHTHTSPPLLLNLNVMLAAVYDERRYAESLSVLSDTLKFIQSVPKFEVEETTYTVEIVTLSPQDLNNVWTLLGGQYYPSVVCKLRRLVIDAEEITSGGSVAKGPVIEM